MTRLEAYAVAERIVGPAGKISPPIVLLPGITDALMKVQEETVLECWMLIEAYLDGISAEAQARRGLQKRFEGVELP